MFLLRTKFARRYLAAYEQPQSDDTVIPIRPQVDQRDRAVDEQNPAAGDESAEAS